MSKWAWLEWHIFRCVIQPDHLYSGCILGLAQERHIKKDKGQALGLLPTSLLLVGPSDCK